MRAPSLFPLLFLILGHFLLPTFATPVRPDAAPVQIYQHKRFCLYWACRNGVVPVWMQTLSPEPSPTQDTSPPTTAAPPTITPPTVPLNNTTPGDDSGSVTQPNPASKAGSSLSSVNAGVALSSRETLLFTVLTSVIATSLIL